MQLYNTLTRQKEQLRAEEGSQLHIYTCGLTVYSHPHIGNWVSYIYWDVLVRSLIDLGYDVNRAQNITDVGHLVSDDDDGEDKMEKGARKENLTAWDVAEKYIAIAEKEAYELLGLLRPNHMPRATDYIKEQIDFVKQLENNEYTYEIPNDGIYFDTAKFPDYGKLAKLDIEGLEAGKRVNHQGKRNKTDFALWKFSPRDSKRDMEWESPWGKGFPGWHLECSVMARELLGDTIDIHTGGIDHIPVHHTNEIAQTEALTNQPLARIWMHNNHLKIDDGKMAKSVGNIVTLSDIIDRGYTPYDFKTLVLSSHYQTEGNFTWDILAAAANRLDNYYACADLQHQSFSVDEWLGKSSIIDDLIAALSDNLDTPKALSLLDKFAEEVATKLIAPSEQGVLSEILSTVDSLLGLDLSTRTDITNKQKEIMAQRESARSSKDWRTSDAMRDELLQDGIVVRDTPHGQVWSRRNR